MDQIKTGREQLRGGSSFAPVRPVSVNESTRDLGQESDERAESRHRQPAGVENRDTSMDETGSSNANTPIATSPSVEAVGGGRSASPGTAASSSANPEGLLPPRRKRNRPAKSCFQCRQRKIRCDRKYPCGSCLRAKFDNCTYRQPETRSWPTGPALSPASTAAPHAHNHQQQPPPAFNPGGHQTPQYHHHRPHYPLQQQPQAEQHLLPRREFGNVFGEDGQPDSSRAYARTQGATGASLPTSSAYPSPHSHITNANGQGATDDSVSGLESVIQQLQQQLAHQGTIIQQLQQGNIRDVAGRTVSGNHVTSPAGAPGPSTARGVLSKSRYFGQSHWMNGIRFFPLITGVVEKLSKNQDQVYLPFMVKCKNLAKSIKQSRVGSMFSFDIGKTVPADEPMARRLLEAYFRTFETVYRILHVPSFWADYTKYWQDRTTASQTFIIQMQLCMAIGTCFQEDVVSLRQPATQWIYEAQFWLAPPEKSRMSLAALQIMCLLHLARETCGIGGDLTWISSGSLMRCAMYMGLQHDPAHLGNMSILRAELRRRLWATILEIALQSSLDSGGPPLISPSDYDTKQPANFDDDQLTDGEHTTIVPRPLGCFTETSVQLTLLRSFPTRLAVAQYVNGFHASASYEQTSRLNAQLQQVSATLQHSYDPAGVLPRRMTLFQLRLAEHMVHRFFLALNQPCLSQARNNADYWFARKACVESSRKLCEGFAKTTSGDHAGYPAAAIDDFARLSTAGAGAFRFVPVQCMMALGVELLWQALDDRPTRPPGDATQAIGGGSGMGTGIGVAPRSELLDALQCCVGYHQRRISCGETNVKGYIFSSALLAQIQALFRGVPDTELEHVVLESLRTSLENCWELLKEVAGAKATPPAPAEPMENWPEMIAGGQEVGDVLGFGTGWDWEDEQAFNFNFDMFSYSDVDPPFSFH